ncbi:MAG: hypothetical protein HOP11_10890 [Saprospiraceae bacterium]|nr:hypothetical protein [Saprospiraceae bacterium]
MKKLINLLICFVALISFTQCSNKCEDINVPYTVRESYKELVHKSITLDHQMSRLSYQRIPGAILIDELPQLKANCTISNSSKYSGNFTLAARFESQGQSVILEETFFIPAYTTKQCEIVKEINHYSFQSDIEVSSWDVTAPTITVQVEETRYRDVTKYRLCNTCDPACHSAVASK